MLFDPEDLLEIDSTERYLWYLLTDPFDEEEDDE
jgi:hypothetical protein